MPVVEYFPYMGPNRRSDQTVIEITLVFRVHERQDVPASRTRQILIDGGIIGEKESFPGQALPGNWMEAYSSLLAQTALLLQRKAGHRVSLCSVEPCPEARRYLALVEHEHCDVGMTAVKLAYELISGRRRMLAEPFQAFSRFAGERLLPYQTEAIIKAAQRRDIPAIQLERQPYKRDDFEDLTGGKCICPNGLLMLGHGEHQTTLDGTWSLDIQQDVSTGVGDPAEVAEQIVERLFPGQQPARMPIIAITGTNGKTTTTRMVNHIMQQAGKRPGMVCTDGVFLGGRQLECTDRSARTGHLQVLTSRSVDIAVLETHHAGILTHGFAFRWCDVAVCLNVTEDHLGVANVDTVAQMAAVKQALPERARHAAVLNADDEHCLAMVGAVRADRVCLVSMEHTVGDLQQRWRDRVDCFCVLEREDGQEWITIHDNGRRLPIIAAAQIPATFDATARFNVSNAMHAIVASHLVGVTIDALHAAMKNFVTGCDTTPWRLNVFDELPFKVIVDYAHNPDGYRQLCDFVDRQVVPGRKLISMITMNDRSPETLANMSAAVAGHFDFYFCREDAKEVDSIKPGERQVGHVMQEALIEVGVNPEQTSVLTLGKNVIFEILDTCRPGDLLILVPAYCEMPEVADYIREQAGRLKGQ